MRGRRRGGEARDRCERECCKKQFLAKGTDGPVYLLVGDERKAVVCFEPPYQRRRRFSFEQLGIVKSLSTTNETDSAVEGKGSVSFDGN